MTTDTSLADLARRMKELGHQKDALEEQLKVVYKEWDHLRRNTILDAMAAIDPDLSKLSIAGVGTVYVRADLYTGMRDKEVALQWLEDNGYHDLIQPQVNPSTLKAWMKEQIREGVKLPDCFKCDPYSYAVIIKR